MVVITDNDVLIKPPFFWQNRRASRSSGLQGRRPTMTQFDGELSPPFEIVEPAQWRAPIIFNSPHSGSVYPREFLNASRIDVAALRRSEDSFMDELIGGPERARLSDGPGQLSRAPMSTSTASPMSSIRGCSPDGCRASPIPARCGWPAASAPSRAWSATARKSIASGFRVDDALARIEALYKPYHRALRRLINKAHQAFGTVILVDCHSMPSVGRIARRAAAAGHRDRRPLRHQLRRACCPTWSRKP